MKLRAFICIVTSTMIYARGNPESLANAVTDGCRKGDIDSCLTIFNEYCDSNKYGMSLGKQKTHILEKAVGFAVEGNVDINILEVGGHCGDSTLAILRNLKGPNHKLYTLEDNVDWYKAAQTILSHASSSSNYNLYNGEYSKILKDFATRGYIYNMIILDSPSTTYALHMHSLITLELLATDCIIVADNIGRDLHLSSVQNFLKLLTQNNFQWNKLSVTEPYSDKVLIATRGVYISDISKIFSFDTVEVEL